MDYIVSIFHELIYTVRLRDCQLPLSIFWTWNPLPSLWQKHLPQINPWAHEINLNTFSRLHIA